MLASEGGAFGGLDLVFFLGYVVTVVTIGFVAGHRKKDTVGDYFRAGNRLPWFAIGFSIIASGISSEQFVGEMGYAYLLGMPVVNWDWLVFPAMSILLWIFIPLYLRGKITTMPEYLERRYGGQARTMYAILIIASYVFVNFAMVFYTGGYAIEKMWGFNRVYAVWILAVLTGAYTIYGGLTSVAWTDFFQCALLLGGGIFLFFAGMDRIDWDFAAVLSAGSNEQYGHLIPPADHPDLPWTALIILALSTNVWYYATDQFINQRCLGARSEWHAKMGVLLAGGLQFFLPLATCFPGMIYRVINPDLADHNAAYPEVVAAVVPMGLRGIVVAAVLGAITSTIAGLVNSTATMTTLDIFQRWKGKDWEEKRLVRFGQYAGGIALLIGAVLAPVVMAWDSLFRYCQDLWAPMAAPATVVFLGGALWKGANERGAVACLWLSILTVPFSFVNKYLIDQHAFYMLPKPMQNPMVFAGSIFLISIVLLVELSRENRPKAGVLRVIGLSVLILAVGSYSAQIIAILVGVTCLGGIAVFMTRNLHPSPGAWDRSMLHLPEGEHKPWYLSLWIWWMLVAAGYVTIYAILW